MEEDKKQSQHMPFPGHLDPGVMEPQFEYSQLYCRGCTMKDREERRLQFIESIAAVADLENDTSYIVFEEEPENQNDPNAVKVLAVGKVSGVLGYVAREHTRAAKDILDHSRSYYVEMQDDWKEGNRELPLIVRWVPIEEP